MYERGKIYKIESPNTENVYVGSTCEKYLSSRLGGHRRNYAHYQNGKYHYVSSFEVFKHGDCSIVLIEPYPCASKDELHSRERYWIENTPNCINKNIPTRTHSEYLKKYNEENKEAIQQYKKNYYKENREAILERSKMLYANKIKKSQEEL